MTVLFKHALRNAIIPVVSLAAVQFGFMLGGSIVIETIFQINGLGYLAWESIQRKDLPMMQAIVLVLSVIYVLLTLLADLLNALLDPRMRVAEMAETSAIARAGMPTAADILAPTPGALLRRRIFGHWGLLIGGADPGRHRADGAARAAARAARSLRPGARAQADPADLARQRQGHLGASARHRSSRPRLPLAG